MVSVGCGDQVADEFHDQNSKKELKSSDHCGDDLGYLHCVEGRRVKIAER